MLTRIALVAFSLTFGAAFVASAVNRPAAQPPDQTRPSAGPGERAPASLQERIDFHNGYHTHPLVVGDHVQAMAQARALHDALKAAEWDWTRLDFGLVRLPDMKFHPNPSSRENTGSFARPRGADADKLAFTCSLYVRQRLVVDPRGKSVRKTDGFMIVGWKDGRIERVPASEIRLIAERVGNEWGARWRVPGQVGYDRNAPGLDDGERIRQLIETARQNGPSP